MYPASVRAEAAIADIRPVRQYSAMLAPLSVGSGVPPMIRSNRMKALVPSISPAYGTWTLTTKAPARTRVAKSSGARRVGLLLFEGMPGMSRIAECSGRVAVEPWFIPGMPNEKYAAMTRIKTPKVITAAVPLLPFEAGISLVGGTRRCYDRLSWNRHRAVPILSERKNYTL